MSSVKLFVLSTLLSVTSAHLGLFNAAGIYPPKDGVQFGGKFDPGYTPAIPLGKDNSIKPPPNGFWFHGADINKAKAQGGNDPSKGTQLALQAGGSVTLEVACNKKWTSMGNGHNPNGDACPDGQELWKSRHVNADPSREVYLGCGLGIAYKSPNEVSDLDQIKAKDITIFSVVNDCVKKRDVTFQIPKDMPPCPPGGCICSWFWQGQESADGKFHTPICISPQANS